MSESGAASFAVGKSVKRNKHPVEEVLIVCVGGGQGSDEKRNWNAI